METVTLGVILSMEWPDCGRSIMESGDDAADYATLQWDAANPRPKPSMVEIQALRVVVTAKLATLAIEGKRRERFEGDGRLDNLFQAIRLLAQQVQDDRLAMKPTSYTGGSRPAPNNGWNTLLQRINAIQNDLV